MVRRAGSRIAFIEATRAVECGPPSTVADANTELKLANAFCLWKNGEGAAVAVVAADGG